MDGPVSEALSSAMGNYMYMGLCDDMDQVREFVRDVFEER